MKHIKIVLLLASVLLLQSCNDFLDIKPKGIQIPEFYDDYVRLLNHKDMMTVSESYLNYVTDDVLLGDRSVPFGQLEQAQENQRNLYTFASGAIFSGGTTDVLWEKAYKRIYTLNVIINNVANCPDGTANERTGLIAQAKAARAYEYLGLVNAYAKHYDAATAKTDLGVPVVLSEDINVEIKRNTVQEVYDRILKDLSDASPAIPEKVPYLFRASKQSLNAFLARVYLYMGDYAKAKTAAEDAIKGGVTMLNLCDYAINPAANGMGRIWNPTTKAAYPNPEDNVESVYSRYGDGIGLSRNIYASEDVLNVYKTNLPAGATDQRRALYFADNTFKLYNNVYNFPGKTMWVAYSQFNQGIGASELYLILAECYARANEPDKALEFVDIVRNNRIKNNKSLAKVGATDALRIVLEERRREFIMGGSMRLIDLKRMNKEEIFKKDIVHTAGDQAWTLPANDNRFILPVPPKVLSTNTGFPEYDR